MPTLLAVLAPAAEGAAGPTGAMGLIWLTIAYALFRRVWRAGVKRFSAVGA